MFIPVVNYHSLAATLDSNLVLGNVVRQSEEPKVLCNTFDDACEVAKMKVECGDDEAVTNLSCTVRVWWQSDKLQ